MAWTLDNDPYMVAWTLDNDSFNITDIYPKPNNDENGSMENDPNGHMDNDPNGHMDNDPNGTWTMIQSYLNRINAAHQQATFFLID